MKHIFKITTAVLAILLAFTLYKLSEKELQLQSAVFNNECMHNTELADAFQELMFTQIAVDENENTSLTADKEYFEEHNIPLKYYEVIKRSAEQLGKDYKAMKNQMMEEYDNVDIPSIREVIKRQHQDFLESKQQQ
ncbi:MAG: hypothetical protein E7131_02155 [Rikenellaceae bacterium]|nr:hypothetical protein [Rikenellaceae bacterium]